MITPEAQKLFDDKVGISIFVDGRRDQERGCGCAWVFMIVTNLTGDFFGGGGYMESDFGSTTDWMAALLGWKHALHELKTEPEAIFIFSRYAQVANYVLFEDHAPYNKLAFTMTSGQFNSGVREIMTERLRLMIETKGKA